MSSSPTRFTSGVTQDASYQPLGMIGIPDPFFYATYADDFLPYDVGGYTVTAATGSVASVAGVGGRVILSTTGVISDFVSMQEPAAGFSYIAGNKLAYLTRINLDSATLSTVQVGLIQTSATPLTVTNGFFFKKASGATAITFTVMSGSAVQAVVTLPTVAVAATDIDLGFVVDRLGNVNIFCGTNLIGAKRQDFATLGPQAKIYATSIATPPAGLLNPTLVVQASTAVIRTMTADFQLAAQER